jgi:4'-phosphopantetheinyl transferase
MQPRSKSGTWPSFPSTAPGSWPQPQPECVRLEKGDVHVWCASLKQPESVLDGMTRTLSCDELERSRRFRFQRHRAAFVISRGLLRTIAGRYLGAPPGELCFAYTTYGKPYLVRPLAGGSLRFNLSHSHELVLYAFAADVEVGIDVEYLRPEFAGAEIARRFFSPREVESLSALPGGRRAEAFFKCWTRKEAFIKAVGEGLSFPLDQFDVTLAPHEPAALLSVRNDAREAARWSMWDVSPEPGYAAALVTEGRVGRVSCWRWQVDV